jgi:hypothetical protein
MKMNMIHLGLCAALAAVGLGSGCASDPNKIGVTNKRQPGPAAGHAVGGAVGAVRGNVAGAIVGFGEGVEAGSRKAFDNTARVVRRWRTETTPDGRTIQIPEDVLVDEYDRPIGEPTRR